MNRTGNESCVNCMLKLMNRTGFTCENEWITHESRVKINESRKNRMWRYELFWQIWESWTSRWKKEHREASSQHGEVLIITNKVCSHRLSVGLKIIVLMFATYTRALLNSGFWLVWLILFHRVGLTRWSWNLSCSLVTAHSHTEARSDNKHVF